MSISRSAVRVKANTNGPGRSATVRSMDTIVMPALVTGADPEFVGNIGLLYRARFLPIAVTGSDAVVAWPRHIATHTAQELGHAYGVGIEVPPSDTEPHVHAAGVNSYAMAARS